VTGYEISTYDMRALSTGVSSALDALDGHLDEVRSSEMTSADFGDSAAGETYVRVVHGALADSLAGFRAAGDRLVRQLTATARQYEDLEDAGAASFDTLR
jgi:hypothetical protein